MFWAGRWVGETATGQRAVMGGDSCGNCRVMGVHGDGVCGAHGVIVVDHHEREVQLISAGGKDGSANITTEITQSNEYINRENFLVN